LGTGRVGSIGERKVGTNGSLFRILEGDGGESLDVQVGAFGTGLDKLSSEGEDGTRLKGSVESSGNGLGTRSDTDSGLMTCLDGHDRGSGSEDIGRGDKRSGSEVCGDTDGFEDTGSGDHGLCVSESGVEVVLAGLYGFGSCTGDGALEGGDVDGLSLADTSESLDLGISEAEGLEVTRGELGEARLVEIRLEMLSGKSAK
jgi:hypothetical protein